MPLVGFGLWKVTKSSCADTVYDAIKAGYRLFDGAGDYGNEKEAGEGVRRAIQDGLVKREDLFITSKLWNTFHAHDHVKSLSKKQLDLWGIDYFDLFLVHFPIALKFVDPAHRYPPEWFGDDGKVHLQNTPMQETWGAMEELVDEGRAKNIGLSNCNGSLILDVLRYARIQPSVLQVELHPYLTQQPLVNLTKTLGIAITAYSSFGPQGYFELDMDKNAPSLLSHDTINAIATKHKKTTAQVVLRWATQRGIAVIPKSNHVERLAQNLSCSSFDLEEEELKTISALNINLRLNDPADIDPRLAIFA
ncbi:NADP-dependent oxidoreductase domain-containing protein [Crucibulum laeve]|uniref:NADP-dependent oxidoreductase domain-containing protein n=1 Tax=Crucibulum laeve TaxID=68775 RepID=A0A5C3LUY3_9AGAR|nr:NADP-dependent oxidoreductase domain-containing protein [Crucibulum laeve]